MASIRTVYHTHTFAHFNVLYVCIALHDLPHTHTHTYGGVLEVYVPSTVGGLSSSKLRAGICSVWVSTPMYTSNQSPTPVGYSKITVLLYVVLLR